MALPRNEVSLLKISHHFSSKNQSDRITRGQVKSWFEWVSGVGVIKGKDIGDEFRSRSSVNYKEFRVLLTDLCAKKNVKPTVLYSCLASALPLIEYLESSSSPKTDSATSSSLGESSHVGVEEASTSGLQENTPSIARPLLGKCTFSSLHTNVPRNTSLTEGKTDETADPNAPTCDTVQHLRSSAPLGSETPFSTCEGNEFPVARKIGETTVKGENATYGHLPTQGLGASLGSGIPVPVHYAFPSYPVPVQYIAPYYTRPMSYDVNPRQTSMKEYKTQCFLSHLDTCKILIASLSVVWGGDVEHSSSNKHQQFVWTMSEHISGSYLKMYLLNVKSSSFQLITKKPKKPVLS